MSRCTRSLALASALLLIGSCAAHDHHTPNPVAPPVDEPTSLALEEVPGGLYSLPILVTAPIGDPRLFVVEKTGRVRIVENGALLPTPFLDIHGQLTLEYEQGLLGLA